MENWRPNFNQVRNLAIEIFFPGGAVLKNFAKFTENICDGGSFQLNCRDAACILLKNL